MHPQPLMICKRRQRPFPTLPALGPRATLVITTADGTPPQALRYADWPADEHVHSEWVKAGDAGEHANCIDAFRHKGSLIKKLAKDLTNFSVVELTCAASKGLMTQIQM